MVTQSSGASLYNFKALQFTLLLLHFQFLPISSLLFFRPVSIKTPLKEQQGPEQGTSDVLEQMGSKDVAAELTNYDWELFTAMHEVRTWNPTAASRETKTSTLFFTLLVKVSMIWFYPPIPHPCDPLQVELIHYVFGRHKFPGAITANLERFVRRFNEVQHWVVTELCLCEDLVKRAILLKKFIKIAAV